MIKYTAFEFGFTMKGTRKTNVGEDIISIFKAPEGWSTPTYSGTPVDIDSANEKQIKKTADGAKPEYLMVSRVNDALTDIERYEQVVNRDEVLPGNPIDMVPFKRGAIIKTKLFTDAYTPVAGDALYVDGGKFTDTDPTAGSGVVVGEIKEVDSEFGRIVLK